jgi:hypothetical protein
MFELSNELLIKSLLFILVFFLTFKALMRFSKNKKISTTIGLMVAILSVIYLSTSQLSLLFKTYGTTGIIVLISIPSLIAFFFIYSSEIAGGLRKIFWIIYGIATILILHQSNLFSLENTTSITIFIIFIIGIILLFDTTIKNQFSIGKHLKRAYR